MVRQINAFIFFFFAFAALSCSADDKSPARSYEAGTHYEVLSSPLRTSNPDKIEVAEFFWYGCSHCYHFEPSVKAWLKNLPEDAYFEAVPAMWHPTMELHAKMFFVAQQLGKLDTLHGSFFNALQVGKMTLGTPEEIAKLFAEQGVDQETFLQAFNSFGTDSQVKQAKAKANGAKIEGTPELLVNGKYRVSARMAGSQPEMLNVVDFLIKQERSQKK